MVERIAKWGGMPSGSLIRELSPLFNLCAPSGRVVPGAFFAQLAELKSPVDSTPARAVNAA
eukprot:8923051-Pyramimonas_sp.AAC.1